MKATAMVTTAIFVASCSVQKMYPSYTDWDSDANTALDRYEFVNGYTQSNYLNKWSDGNESITYQDLYEGVFEDLDADNDNKLSLVEFNGRIDAFYFGIFNGTFDKWDFDSNASIDTNEFYRHVCKTNLAALWDNSDDKAISRSELADGMFYLADTNGNGRVDTLEFRVWKANRS